MYSRQLSIVSDFGKNVAERFTFAPMNKWMIIALTVVVALGCRQNPDAGQSSEAYHEKLVENLNKQVNQYPDSPQVRMRLVNALDSLGRFSDALVHIDTMIMKDSLNNGLWFAKAQLLESNKDTLAAIKSYEHALAIYPSLETQLNLANLYAETRDERSLAICQSIYRMGMDRAITAHCDFISGVYFARTQQHQKAIEAFDRCINNNYTYMEAYMEKGFVFYEQKKWKEAVAVFERAITVNNMYADAYYWKAKTHESMGNKEEALLDYKRALGLDKKLAEAREAISRLQ